MSQKELIEEGFSDKIRGIAKAIKTGVKQAARQGTRLDTGQLAGGMKEAYKGQQPIAVLKATLAKEKDIDIVKINKGGIKKQQASAKKGYIGRIVGPKSITLIPFEGVLLGAKKRPEARRYEGPSAGAIKEGFAPEDAEATGQERDETGKIKAVHEGGRVGTQIKNLLVKHGIGEGEAARLSQYDEKSKGVRTAAIFKETHPNIKFTFNPKPEMSTVDVEKTKHAEVAPGDVRESVSLRSIIQLSREVLIVEASKRQAELRERARKAGVAYSKYRSLDELQKAVEEAEKSKGSADRADEAERRYKERNPEEAEPEPEPVAEPEAKEVDPKNLPYLETGDHRKFIATLDDKVVLDLLKLKQKIQPGLQIKFEDEKEPEEDAAKGEEGMFVAEIFRTKEGLKVGDIYRQDDPTDIVWPTGQAKRDRDREDKQGGKSTGVISPVDVAVAELTAENRPITLTELISRMQLVVKDKKKGLTPDSINLKLLKPDAVLKKTGLKDATTRLSSKEIAQVKKAMIELQIITERTSQKILLRQLTLLSR